MYLTFAATVIVNLLVTIINDTHGKSKRILREDDILQFLSNKSKENFRKRKAEKIERKRERLRSLVKVTIKVNVAIKTVDEILLSGYQQK